MALKIFIRWTVVLAATIGGFWLLWHFIVGEVPKIHVLTLGEDFSLVLPDALTLSRWWDLLLAPLAALPPALILSRRIRGSWRSLSLAILFGLTFGFELGICNGLDQCRAGQGPSSAWVGTMVVMPIIGFSAALFTRGLRMWRWIGFLWVSAVIHAGLVSGVVAGVILGTGLGVAVAVGALVGLTFDRLAAPLVENFRASRRQGLLSRLSAWLRGE